MNESKKEILKIVLLAILSLFLVFCLLFATVLFSFDRAFCREESLIAAARESEYQKGLTESLAANCEPLSFAAGVENTVPEAALREWITEEVAFYPIRKIFSENVEEPSFASLRAQLLQSLSDFAEKKAKDESLYFTEEEWREVEEGLSSLCDYYMEEVNNAILLGSFFAPLSGALRSFRALLPYGYAGVAGLLFFCLLLCFLIGKKGGFCLSLYAAFGATGLVALFFPLWFCAQHFAARLQINPMYFRLWLASSADGLMQTMLSLGILMLVLAGIFGILALIMKKKEKKA